MCTFKCISDLLNLAPYLRSFVIAHHCLQCCPENKNFIYLEKRRFGISVQLGAN